MVILSTVLLPACGRIGGAENASLTASAAATSLVGQWQLVSYGPEDQPVEIPAGLQLTLWLSRDYLQWHGCNFLEAEYTVRDQTLLLGSVTSTAVGCVPGLPAQLDGIMQTALQPQTAFAIEGDTLTIPYPGGIQAGEAQNTLEMPTAPPPPPDVPPAPEPMRTPTPTGTLPPPPPTTSDAPGNQPTPTVVTQP